jgi:6-pyruvoyltetrahydropterin/6-carboxytetrahydropterin synthase
MHLITLKRFEFSAAHTVQGQLQGDNFIVWVGVSGPLDSATGMVINVTELKHTVNAVLEAYDHRNLDTQLRGQTPTLISIAQALWKDLESEFQAPLSLNIIEIETEGGPQARLTAHGAETIQFGMFSAAHRTHAPSLNDAENQQIYGICNNPAGHGHNYRAALSLPPEGYVPESIWAEFDHKNLSVDIPEFQHRNVVTETIAELMARRAPTARQVRVWELPTFFVDYFAAQKSYALGRRYQFNAAHRLNSPQLSKEDNAQVYGKCNRPDPHGHSYFVEVTVSAPALDPLTETAYDLGKLDAVTAEILRPLHRVWLERDVAHFQTHPSTGENIALYLWQQFSAALGIQLASVTIWETPNNQFRVLPSL